MGSVPPKSKALAALQAEATTHPDPAAAFRDCRPAATELPALTEVEPRIVSASSIDGAFLALRCLGGLLDALTELQADGAFAPMRRTGEVRYIVGQRLEHQEHGPCIVYGWDHSNAVGGEAASASLAGIVDNRRKFRTVGADAHCEKAQPFYRVHTVPTEAHPTPRSYYCAQELLRPVNREKVPRPAKSFFFTRDDPRSGCLIARPELARRYPDDMELIARTWSQSWELPRPNVRWETNQQA